MRRESLGEDRKLSQLMKGCAKVSEGGLSQKTKEMLLQREASISWLSRLRTAEELKKHSEGEPEQVK